MRQASESFEPSRLLASPPRPALQPANPGRRRRRWRHVGPESAAASVVCPPRVSARCRLQWPICRLRCRTRYGHGLQQPQPGQGCIVTGRAHNAACKDAGTTRHDGKTMMAIGIPVVLPAGQKHPRADRSSPLRLAAWGAALRLIATMMVAATDPLAQQPPTRIRLGPGPTSNSRATLASRRAAARIDRQSQRWQARKSHDRDLFDADRAAAAVAHARDGPPRRLKMYDSVEGGIPRIELGTSPTRRENHATRPNPRAYCIGASAVYSPTSAGDSDLSSASK